MAVTTRWGIPYPQLDGLVAADVPFWMNAMAVALDDVAKDDQGTLANRPVSTAGSPGKKGRYYMVKGDSTAANNGILWRDNGTGWDQVGASTIFDTRVNRPAANAVPAGQRFFATDQISEWIGDGAAWYRLGDQAGDIVWTNETVRTGYVLLDGAAWPGTTGIYVDLYAKWAGTNLPDIRGRQAVALGTNAAVSALLANDGVAVANRRGTKHQHTTHNHGGATGGPNHPVEEHGTGGTGYPFGSGSSDANVGSVHTHTIAAADGGSGVATDPVDGGAFLVLQPQAKL